MDALRDDDDYNPYDQSREYGARGNISQTPNFRRSQSERGDFGGGSRQAALVPDMVKRKQAQTLIQIYIIRIMIANNNNKIYLRSTLWWIVFLELRITEIFIRTVIIMMMTRSPNQHDIVFGSRFFHVIFFITNKYLH